MNCMCAHMTQVHHNVHVHARAMLHALSALTNFGQKFGSKKMDEIDTCLNSEATAESFTIIFVKLQRFILTVHPLPLCHT